MKETQRIVIDAEKAVVVECEIDEYARCTYSVPGTHLDVYYREISMPDYVTEVLRPLRTVGEVFRDGGFDDLTREDAGGLLRVCVRDAEARLRQMCLVVAHSLGEQAMNLHVAVHDVGDDCDEKVVSVRGAVRKG